MKKLACILLTIITLLGTLAACGAPKQCEVCDQEYTGKSYTVNVFGEKLEACEQCNEELKELF